MTDIKAKLFEAFKEDHAALGQGFYDLAEALRNKDLQRAKQIAEELNAAAGAHIAFEEQDFYPRLRNVIGQVESEALYKEHEKGLGAVISVLEMEEGEQIDSPHLSALLSDIEAMEVHIAECGALFGAMAEIPQAELEELHDQLIKWREARPKWTDYRRTWLRLRSADMEEAPKLSGAESNAK